jgi:hypothetical protein
MRAVLVALSILGLAGAGVAALAPALAQSEVERSYNVGAFDSIAVAGPYRVIVTPGRTHSVHASGPAEALERLEVEVQRGGLRIGTRRGSWLRPTKGGIPGATLRVTAPSLSSAAIAGSGDMRIERVEGRSFSASVAGSGDMDLPSIRVQEARFSIAGSGDIRAAGSADSVNINIAGSGDTDLRGFETRAVRVSIMGSGDVRLRATESATVRVMGSGDVRIAGGARCDVSRRGSGRVICGD